MRAKAVAAPQRPPVAVRVVLKGWKCSWFPSEVDGYSFLANGGVHHAGVTEKQGSRPFLRPPAGKCVRRSITSGEGKPPPHPSPLINLSGSSQAGRASPSRRFVGRVNSPYRRQGLLQREERIWLSEVLRIRARTLHLPGWRTVGGGARVKRCGQSQAVIQRSFAARLFRLRLFSCGGSLGGFRTESATAVPLRPAPHHQFMRRRIRGPLADRTSGTANIPPPGAKKKKAASPLDSRHKVDAREHTPGRLMFYTWRESVVRLEEEKKLIFR